MTPDQFLALAGALPEPLLLLRGDGEVLAANRPAADLLGAASSTLPGRRLSELVLTPPGELQRYLRACAKTRQMLPGTIQLRADGEPSDRCGCEGAVVQPRSSQAPAVILLRLKPSGAATQRFTLLNERIDRLSREIRERRQAERALSESEEHFRSLSAQSPVGIFRSDAEGRNTYTNTRCQEIGGFRPEEALGAGWAQFVHPEDRDRVLSEWMAYTSGHGQFDCDCRFQTRDGPIRWVHFRASPMMSAASEVLGHVGTVEDITARRRSEALVASQKQVLELIVQGQPLGHILEELTQAVQKQSPNGVLPSVLLLDRDGVHLRHGAGAALPDGYRRAIDGVAIGPAVGSCGTAAYRKEPVVVTDIATDPLWTDYRDLALAHGLRACWSTPILSAAGRVLGTFAMYYPSPSSPGPDDQQLISLVTRTAAIAIERKQAEEDLRDQQKWLEAVLNLMPVPMLLIEPGTARVTFANRAADEMAGGDFPKGTPAPEYHTVYACTDAEGTPIPNERMPGVRVAQGERLDGLQIGWQTPGGNRSLILFGDTIPAIHGHAASGVVMFQDISSIKRIETELQRANRLKDEFLATVSHELRTPLNAMLGWARMLRTGRLDAATSDRALQTIERSAKAQEQLIEDLLDVSRIISGKLRLDIQTMDPVSAIESAIDALRPAAEGKDVGLQVTLDPRARLVAGDSDRLQQVVWNLLSNAIKFTPARGTVRIDLQRVDSQVQITVSDTGKGIRAEFLPYVFDRFSQADGSITRAQGGLGLGLAIVRHLVELHGGTVQVSSAGEGLGTTFAVRLPVATVRVPGVIAGDVGQPPLSPDREAPFECPPVLAGLRVLVVDDNPDARELLATVLGWCRAEVTGVESVAEAIDRLTRLTPDIIISDIEMPDEDGYGLIQRVRNLDGERGRQIPAIALTAHARIEDRLRVLSAGFDTHVTKPVEPTELVAVIASLAERRMKPVAGALERDPAGPPSAVRPG
ncbi:MAG: ATP-binding protein [Acidobacteriota bacterium]